MNRIASTVSVVSVLAACGMAFGQANEGDSNSTTISQPSTPIGGVDALGDSIGCAVDINTLTGDPANLGIEFAWGYYFVSRRADGVTGGQFISQFDEDWNLVEDYVQATLAVPWGGRDGASIESENALFFGADNGELIEYRWDPTTERLDLTQTTIMNGAINTVRALAWDPNNEVFYTKSFGGTIEIMDRNGNTLDIVAADSISAYGAAYDQVNQTVWFHAYRTGTTGSSDAPKTRLVEWDPATRDVTGREFDTDAVGGDPLIGYIPGGADIESDGTNVTAIVLAQGDPYDFVQRYAIIGDGSPCGSDCRADIDGDGALTIFDFLAFQNAFDAGDLLADFDGDGALTIFDFLAFQNEFDAGCP
ncbi:MAG: hypothetical protein NCW75_06415 [Phycisphaera sp.]|nr:MAG: hypothetical protein NCW75_06415 [Phycisphaera sp.]